MYDWMVAQQTPLLRLLRRLHDLRVVPFVGAGVPMQVGLPGWPALVNALAAQVQARRSASPRQRLPADPLLAVEHLRLALGDSYLPSLQRQFELTPRHKAEIQTNALMKALAQLECAHWVTTNYDLVLEEVLRTTSQGVDSYSCWADEVAINCFLMGQPRRRKRRAVIHLHGLLSQPEDVVLSESEYQERYWRAAGGRVRLATLLSTWSALFVGTSLADEDMKSVLREVRCRFRSRHAPHFWLRAAPVDDTDRLHWREKFGVEIIAYPPDDGHAALAPLVEWLAQATPKDAAEGFQHILRERELGSGREGVDDPNKNRFGGSAQANGWILDASVRRDPEEAGWYSVRLRVHGTGVARVTLHLHPTFPEPVVSLGDIHGHAATRLQAWGAFTVGAVIWPADGRPEVRLELDLAEVRGAPKAFRER